MNDAQREAMTVVAEVSGRPVEEIRAEMDLVADLSIDSPKALQLLVELETRLGIEISDDEAASMDTVGDILGFVGQPG